jgi:hypothetical protein
MINKQSRSMLAVMKPYLRRQRPRLCNQETATPATGTSSKCFRSCGREGEAAAEMLCRQKKTKHRDTREKEKKERATEKATALRDSTMQPKLLNYQNKEHGQNKEHEAEATFGEEESVNR